MQIMFITADFNTYAEIPKKFCKICNFFVNL